MGIASLHPSYESTRNPSCVLDLRGLSPFAAKYKEEAAANGGGREGALGPHPEPTGSAMRHYPLTWEKNL